MVHGIDRAVRARMVARRFEELVAWQLATAVHAEVLAYTARPGVARDRRFCDQARDAAASAPRNLAEGFGRFAHREFAQFTRIALASLRETQNHLRHALAARYLEPTEFSRIFRLTGRAASATTGLLRYLRTHETPPQFTR